MQFELLLIDLHSWMLFLLQFHLSTIIYLKQSVNRNEISTTQNTDHKAFDQSSMFTVVFEFLHISGNGNKG